MKNQFFYTRLVAKKQQVEGEEIQYDEFTDSFNINKVIRSIEFEKGKLLILLDDLHRRKEIVPIHNKQGKVTGTKNEESTYQSEVYLTEKEDVDNFRRLLSVEFNGYSAFVGVNTKQP